MTSEKLYESIGDIKEQHILEAKQPKEKKPFHWMKVYAIAACLCLVLGVSSFFLVTLFAPGNGTNGGSAFGDAGSKLLASHPEDFSPEIDTSILAQFENPDAVLKTYQLLTNQWFLSNELEDFSQVVTTKVYYAYPGDDEGGDLNTAYSVYEIDENGKLEWDCTVHSPTDASVPYGLSKLTHDIIESDLSDIEYEDYIITEAPRLASVFVWVRTSSEDLILTYPMRPDWMDLENGEIYTLEELQEILKEAQNRQ